MALRRRASFIPNLTLPSDFVPTLRPAQTSPPWLAASFLHPDATRKPRKRALLIGIRGSLGSDYPELKSAHSDVKKMRSLLMKSYGYKAHEITVLIDDGIASHAQPTGADILDAIDELVKDTQPGDRLYFHYSGHSTQVKTESKWAEEDDMDEYIVPCDGEDSKIVDDILHARLVAPLPEESSLVAVLDTCHSGSLLDLKHNRCNRIYVPWQWRGHHKPEEVGVRYRMVRANGRYASPVGSDPVQTPAHAAQTAAAAKRASVRRNIRRSAIYDYTDPIPGPSRVSTATSFSSIASQVKRAVPCLPRIQTHDLEEKAALNEKRFSPTRVFFDVEDEMGAFCESPVPVFCTGWCRPEHKHHHTQNVLDEMPVRADVMSLASCKDSQLAWENANGASLTSRLVDLLRKDQNRSLEDVLSAMSWAAYDMSFDRHEGVKCRRQWFYESRVKFARWSDKLQPKNRGKFDAAARKLALNAIKALRPIWKEERDIKKGGEPDDMDEFQNPELSSARPLNMQRRWMM
ncbi:Metacaspase pca1 [Mycena chlorophos]|uniref:Metacaspase pca1 n=1 Tax=Mycena chlorophos TaxID=658473 RepID=A0A8H6SBI1_MYCCL|nr:Metacaspase pca1 [Mycena chlorophos]